LRVVLAQALDRDEPEQEMFAPPGLGHLASFTSAKMDGLEFFYAEDAQAILRKEPDVVGISAVSENFDAARKIAAGVRGSFDGPMFLGGIHISTLPESLPDEFDAGVVGEGELVFLELLRTIESGGKQWKDSLASIPGLCYRSDSDIALTAPGKAIADLDTLPYPDQKFLGSDWSMPSENMQLILTSRGCPYTCSFCSSSHFWRRVRYFSVEYVLGELEHLVGQYSPASILIGDDLFIANKKRLAAISEGVRSLGIDKEVTFLCMVRSSDLNEEICKLLSAMNVRAVAVGMESASDHVLELLDKRTTVRQHEGALRMLNDHGFSVTASFILGTPGETLDDIKQTVDFIQKHQCKYFEFDVFPLIPYPGTRVWEDAAGRKVVDKDTPSDRFKLGTMGFDPEEYIYLNEAVPRDTFLYYFFYLKFMSYRNLARRRADRDINTVLNDEPSAARLLKEYKTLEEEYRAACGQLEEARAEIDRRGVEIERATAYVAGLEKHIEEITGYARELEQAVPADYPLLKDRGKQQ